MTRHLTKLLSILTIAAATAATQAQSANLLVDPGFETSAYSLGFPTVFGVWGGDVAEFVGAHNGVQPFSGQRMVWHIYTDWGGPGSTAASDVAQLVDLSAYQQWIESGLLRVRMRSRVNRIAGGPQTDTAFKLLIIFRNAAGGDILQQVAHLYTDANPATWEEHAAEWAAPAGTTHAFANYSAEENVLNNTSGVELDGHYTDDASFEVVIICYPDCTADGVLTVADFGCFQTKFVAADPYADCNADGSLNVQDFGCFQTRFVTGCP